MAAPAPLVPVVVPAAAPGNPLFDEDPVYLPAGHSLVAATSTFIQWQPVAAAANAPPQQVAAPFFALLYAFGIRCKVSPLPADLAAARGINPFTMRFQAACWSRVLSELCASGLAPPGVMYNNVAELHVLIGDLVLQNPNSMLITANDWNAAAQLTSPGAAAAQAAARARFDQIAFLGAASIPSLEITAGPRARKAPWAAISLLAGALGPVGRNAARFAAGAPSVLVAAIIRGESTAADAVLASILPQVLVGSLLSAPYRSHSVDQAGLFAELVAGLRYQRSDADKAAVEEHRIYYARPWYPTIGQSVLDLGNDEGEIVSALRVLQKAMLPSEFHDTRLADALPKLETQLAMRMPTINPILAQPNATLSDMTAALLAENAVMAQPGQSAANNIVGGGAPGGGADADGLALARQSFKNVEVALGRYDLTSEAGQVNAITAVLAVSDCVLASRILLHPNPRTSDAASSRNATCMALNGLRPQLFNYFNTALRLDTSNPAAPVMPPHMKSYVFATATGREDTNSLLSQLLRFEFDAMDYFATPHGAGGWARCVNVSSAIETVAKANYYVQLSNLERIKSFVNILLVSLGIPQSLPGAAGPAPQGYTWPAFVDFYVSKLKLAAGLPLLIDQYAHIAACAKIFGEALVALRYRLTALVRDPDPSSRSLQVPIFPADGTVILDLVMLGTEISRKRQARGDMQGAFKMHDGKAPTPNWETLRLDDPFYVDHLKKKAKVGDLSSSLTVGMDSLSLDLLAGADGAGGPDGGLAPGSLSKSWRWHKSRLIISGHAWDVAGLAKHLGVPDRGVGAPCWPFLLANCADKNRLARCGAAGKAGHETFGSPCHSLLASFDRESMAKQFATAATPEQTVGIVKVPEGRGKGRGRGDGRGRSERGRGRQGVGQVGPSSDGAQLASPATELRTLMDAVDSLKRRLAAADEPDPKQSSPTLRLAAAPQVRFAGSPLLLQHHPDADTGPNFEQPPQREPAGGGKSLWLKPNTSMKPNFGHPPQHELPGDGANPRPDHSVIRNFRFNVGDVSEDLAINRELARLLHDLPTARRNALAATSLRELQSPLKTLATSLSSQGKFVVDCGGQGQCGPNTLSYLLGLVNLATLDGPQLRRAVIEHVMIPAHRARRTRFRDRQGRFYTLEGLILRCQEDDSGPAGALTNTVESWCHHIAQPASWTDLAFMQVAADCYKAAIVIHTVDDLSHVGSLGVILPCHGTTPDALLEVGMWIGRHLVAVVTADGSSGRAAQPPTPPSALPDRTRALIVQVHHDDSDCRSATRATYPESERAPPPSRRLAAATSGSSVQPPPPLTLADVRGLLLSDEAPTILVACEFSGALTIALQARGLRTLSCDLRPALHHFPHYLGDVRDIVGLRYWERAYFFPNCFQHLRGDEHCLHLKIHDCRAFWAGAMVLWCLTCPHAAVVVVEQPDTIVYDYVDVSPFASVYEFRTSEYGDPAEHDKFVRLAVVNATLRPPTHPVTRQQHRPSHLDYPDPEARDRARSSWLPHVLTCQALADLHTSGRLHDNSSDDVEDDDETPTYLQIIAVFIINWMSSGHPVPADHLSPDARPTDPEWRRYQDVRGPGDGRRPPLTEPIGDPYGDDGWDDTPDDDHDLLLRPLPFHGKHGRDDQPACAPLGTHALAPPYGTANCRLARSAPRPICARLTETPKGARARSILKGSTRVTHRACASMLAVAQPRLAANSACTNRPSPGRNHSSHP